jgi:hypothetical protein
MGRVMAGRISHARKAGTAMGTGAPDRRRFPLSGACQRLAIGRLYKKGEEMRLGSGASLADNSIVLMYTDRRMKRTRGSWIALAITLSALLPMVQSHCMWMPFEARAAAAQPSSHGCCESAPAQDAQPCSPTDCSCFQLPPSTIPASSLVSPPLPSIAVVLDRTIVDAAQPSTRAPAPAVDVGSPPLPVALDALGSRAPPLS